MSMTAHSLTGDDILMGGSATPDDASFSLVDLLTIQAEANPGNIFLTPSGQTRNSHTYAQAHDAVSRLSAFLQSLKLPQGSVIGLLMPNQPSAVIALLACLDAGYGPMLLPAHARFSELSALIQHAQCAAMITDECTDRKLPDLAVRLAAASEDVRFVMGFGAAVPNGVLSLDQAMRSAAAPSHHATHANFLFISGINQRPTRLFVEALVATATEHAAESGLDAASRIICPLAIHTLQALCCGLISALMTGAELHLLDAPDSSSLTSALLSPRPGHLLWPGAAEDMLDDIPANALHCVTLIHKTPWERRGHHSMKANPEYLCIDAWVFQEHVVAFAGRKNHDWPTFPIIHALLSCTATQAMALGQNANGQLFACGTAVQGFSSRNPSWIDLGCTAFHDQDGTIIALETPSFDHKNSAPAR